MVQCFRRCVVCTLPNLALVQGQDAGTDFGQWQVPSSNCCEERCYDNLGTYQLNIASAYAHTVVNHNDPMYTRDHACQPISVKRMKSLEHKAKLFNE